MNVAAPLMSQSKTQKISFKDQVVEHFPFGQLLNHFNVCSDFRPTDEQVDA